MKQSTITRLSIVIVLFALAGIIGLTLDSAHQRNIELHAVRDSLRAEQYSHNADLVDWSNANQILIDSLNALNNGHK